jgi:AI-2E family transporter
VPFAIIWGLLAAALRFIPYVGSVIAAFLPFVLGLAVFPGWLQPALVVALFIMLELVTGTLVQPWLYGQSAGVSQVALLVAVTFWTWLWGPAGLLLATPLTVCLIVLGKHLPALGFLVVLMGDRPVIEAKARYYQRLLAHDQDEATDVVEGYVAAEGEPSAYDAVLLPALFYAKQDRDRGLLAEADARFVVQATRDVLDVLAQDTAAPAVPETTAAGITLLGYPARDEADAVALEMVRRLLRPLGYRMEVSAPAMLTAEVVTWVEQHRAGLLCIGTVAPGGLSQARLLCKRLRSQYPALKIVVGRFGLHDEMEADRLHLLAAGADHVESTVADTQRTLLQLRPPPLGRTAPDTSARAVLN